MMSRHILFIADLHKYTISECIGMYACVRGCVRVRMLSGAVIRGGEWRTVADTSDNRNAKRVTISSKTMVYNDDFVGERHNANNFDEFYAFLIHPFATAVRRLSKDVHVRDARKEEGVNFVFISFHFISLLCLSFADNKINT